MVFVRVEEVYIIATVAVAVVVATTDGIDIDNDDEA